ncbi:hypothetical protein HOA55_05435 [archaeon]|jgi:hypothetical protein|nr:hypothetical protein [archaeon]MBT3577763.1 hypothetical protein [archaeon]MBT6820770.1 hypothetical protein [archaeon]MBT6956502.1 hypothetical protein [archaeon]MBT7025910.1 hypothetical protein [archaeon]
MATPNEPYLQFFSNKHEPSTRETLERLHRLPIDLFSLPISGHSIIYYCPDGRDSRRACTSHHGPTAIKYLLNSLEDTFSETPPNPPASS